MREKYTIKPVVWAEYQHLVLEVHYAKRRPPISFAFGLFKGDALAGVVCYGKPSSSPLRRGICGPENEGYVWELTRLVLVDNAKNEASMLVGRSLKMLAKPAIIVSFADTAEGHAGTVYQAANFIYTGLSAKRTDWTVAGMEGKHGQTIADEFRGKPGRRVDHMRAKYGDAFTLEPRSRKHRYIYFLGDKRQRAAFMAALRYKVAPYPKQVEI
jgi:hypothetical protein